VPSLGRPAPGRGARGERPLARPLLAAAVALVAALAAAGCVSIPSAGPVQSFPVTQGSDAQGVPYQQVLIGPPRAGWSPTQIVQGFLAASASFGNNWRVAREYMTPQASKAWRPSWSATVYSNGPTVSSPHYKLAPIAKPKAAVQPAATGKPAATAKKSAKPQANQALVTITGSVLANLSGYGSYAVPSSSAPNRSPGTAPPIKLVTVPGQGWRIASVPPKLLLTSDSFKSDYQLRNLYFFDPTSRYLVPDPVYVPLQANPADLITGLVHDLVTPPADWLSGGATRTAFPARTSIGVALAGLTAVINLGGPITKSVSQVLQQVSAQLLYTLSGSGQGGQVVHTVEVELNGKPWIPLGNSPANPVQRESGSKYVPAAGASKTFYYLDGLGDVMSSTSPRGPLAMVEHVGAGYSQVAVSPDGRYLALLRPDGDLFIGPVGGALAKRSGGQYTTMSWDPNDDLWATMNNQVVMLRGAENQAQPTAVSVVSFDGSGAPVATLFTAVRVAPDGVRVALVDNGTELYFGAISWQEGAANPSKATLRIALSPVAVSTGSSTTFRSLTWYGSDDVITLTGPGPAVTEYPVNGAAATSISATANMKSISASAGSPLLAGLTKNRMVSDASLTGSWVPIAAAGLSPVYPG
jgi:hypothetical protein